MTVLACPSCASRLRAPEGSTARRFKCPKCGGVIAGTDLAAADPSARPVRANAGAATGAAAAVARPARSAVAPNTPASRPPAARPAAARPAAAPATVPAARTVLPAPPPMPLLPPLPPPWVPPGPPAADPASGAGYPAPPPLPLPGPAAAGPKPARRKGPPVWGLVAGGAAALVSFVVVGFFVTHFLLGGSSKASRENFNRINLHMPEADVEAFMGNPDETSVSGDRRVAIWFDRKARVIVMFSRSRVIGKQIVEGEIDSQGKPTGHGAVSVETQGVGITPAGFGH